MIKCKVCDEFFKSITPTHLRKHNMTTTEYKEKYNVKYLWDEQARKKVSGENSPIYKSRIIFKCEYCGKEKRQHQRLFDDQVHHFCCVECHNKWQATENNPKHIKFVKFKCDFCGRDCLQHPSQYVGYEHHFCDTKCSGKWYRGRSRTQNWSMSVITVRRRCY